MTSLRRLLCCLMLTLPALPVFAAPAAVVTTPQVRAELLAQAPDGVVPGKPLWLGLKIEPQPHWHTYWKNPGDSGLPTTLAFSLPPGFSAGEIQWPTPEKLPVGPLLNYGYEHTVLLPVAVTVPSGFAGDTLKVKLRADWLVCKDVCIPEGGDFVLDVPAQAATAGDAALFASAQAAMPRRLPGVTASAAVKDGALVVTVVGLPAAWQGRELSFFSEEPALIQHATKPQTVWQGDRWAATVPLDPQRRSAPTLLPAVLVAPGEPSGVQLQVELTTPWPAAAAPPAPLPPLVDPTPASSGTSLPAANAPVTTVPVGAPAATASLGWALLLALLGGALLNLMPCVFPVLSLKVMGFASHAGQPGARRALLAGGLAYTAGVVLSFVALAGLLLALRAGGEQLGWGFQLQSPLVVALLAALFTLIGLNLAGLFEFGSVLPSSWAAARARHPVVDSLLTGVLAVAVASPCTAPFMGASLGLAVTLPTVQALAVFAALGLGMALPYLGASAWPPLARALPRPGPWMAHFKTLMAFPMFATVVWLTWVLGLQVGIDGVAALLLLLLALAFAAWALGSPTLGRTARGGFGAAAAVVLVATLVWAVPALREGAAPAAGAAVSASGERWEPWSAARVAEATAAGRPVFVDFTAAWCVTCQFNKRSTLADPDVHKAFDERGVLLLRADWTRRDPAIGGEINRLGRSGVPVYALYAPNTQTPQLLSELLTVGEVRAAVGAMPLR